MGIANSAAISEGKFSVSFNVISFSRCFVSGSNVAWMKLVFFSCLESAQIQDCKRLAQRDYGLVSALADLSHSASGEVAPVPILASMGARRKGRATMANVQLGKKV